MNRNNVITDTHAHLCDSIFEPDLAEIIEKARSAGIGDILCVGEDLQDAKRNIELAGVYPGLRPAAGLYPAVLDIQEANDIIEFIQKNRDKLFAVGEVGLDYWLAKDEPRREIQREIFGMFIRLSQDMDLPLNVHSRSAGRQAVEILIDRNAHRVQLHAFDGKASSAIPGIESGFFFSIPPSIVRSRQKQKLVRQLPISCLLIESDSPALGPDQGKRNEPANAVLVVKAIADIKEMEEQEVIEIIAENTRRLYGDLKGEIYEESDSWKNRA